MKKIAVINDLSGMGKCSLTAALPVISVMGVQAVPLPTAILSAQTGFPSYFYDDYTGHMDEIIREWKKMDFCPDGIYTGFLSGADQAGRVLKFMDLFAQEDTKILVDPVMGDNGEEYPIYTEELCERMRLLAQRASVITPNLTEALLLLYGRERTRQLKSLLTGVSAKDLKEDICEIGERLSEKFDTEVVITGIDLLSGENTPQMANLICSRHAKNAVWVTSVKEGGSFSGTGDLFASVLAAGMVKGVDTAESVRRASAFLSSAIHDTVMEGTDRNEGVCFETYLYTLA